MNTHTSLVLSQSVWGVPLEPSGTPRTTAIVSESLDQLVNDLATRFEVALDLAPWLKAGEDTLRRLDGLIQ